MEVEDKEEWNPVELINRVFRRNTQMALRFGVARYVIEDDQVVGVEYRKEFENQKKRIFGNNYNPKTKTRPLVSTREDGQHTRVDIQNLLRAFRTSYAQEDNSEMGSLVLPYLMMLLYNTVFMMVSTNEHKLGDHERSGEVILEPSVNFESTEYSTVLYLSHRLNEVPNGWHVVAIPATLWAMPFAIPASAFRNTAYRSLEIPIESLITYAYQHAIDAYNDGTLFELMNIKSENLYLSQTQEFFNIQMTEFSKIRTISTAFFSRCALLASYGIISPIYGKREISDIWPIAHAFLSLGSNNVEATKMASDLATKGHMYKKRLSLFYDSNNYSNAFERFFLQALGIIKNVLLELNFAGDLRYLADCCIVKGEPFAVSDEDFATVEKILSPQKKKIDISNMKPSILKVFNYNNACDEVPFFRYDENENKIQRLDENLKPFSFDIRTGLQDFRFIKIDNWNSSVDYRKSVTCSWRVVLNYFMLAAISEDRMVKDRFVQTYRNIITKSKVQSLSFENIKNWRRFRGNMDNNSKAVLARYGNNKFSFNIKTKDPESTVAKKYNWAGARMRTHYIHHTMPFFDASIVEGRFPYLGKNFVEAMAKRQPDTFTNLIRNVYHWIRHDTEVKEYVTSVIRKWRGKKLDVNEDTYYESLGCVIAVLFLMSKKIGDFPGYLQKVRKAFKKDVNQKIQTPPWYDTNEPKLTITSTKGNTQTKSMFDSSIQLCDDLKEFSEYFGTENNGVSLPYGFSWNKPPDGKEWALPIAKGHSDTLTDFYGVVLEYYKDEDDLHVVSNLDVPVLMAYRRSIYTCAASATPLLEDFLTTGNLDTLHEQAADLAISSALNVPRHIISNSASVASDAFCFALSISQHHMNISETAIGRIDAFYKATPRHFIVYNASYRERANIERSLEPYIPKEGFQPNPGYAFYQDLLSKSTVINSDNVNLQNEISKLHELQLQDYEAGTHEVKRFISHICSTQAKKAFEYTFRNNMTYYEDVPKEDRENYALRFGFLPYGVGSEEDIQDDTKSPSVSEIAQPRQTLSQDEAFTSFPTFDPFQIQDTAQDPEELVTSQPFGSIFPLQEQPDASFDILDPFDFNLEEDLMLESSQNLPFEQPFFDE